MVATICFFFSFMLTLTSPIELKIQWLFHLEVRSEPFSLFLPAKIIQGQGHIWANLRIVTIGDGKCINQSLPCS